MVFVDFAIIGHDLILTCDLGYRFRDGTQMKVISCDESKYWELDPEDICEGDMQCVGMKISSQFDGRGVVMYSQSFPIPFKDDTTTRTMFLEHERLII